jgi:hypothetical protein
MFPLATAALRNSTFFAHVQDVVKMALYGVVLLKKKLLRTVLHHPPYSIVLVPSYLESSKTGHQEGTSFGDDEEVIEEVAANKISDWNKKGIYATVSR